MAGGFRDETCVAWEHDAKVNAHHDRTAAHS